MVIMLKSIEHLQAFGVATIVMQHGGKMLEGSHGQPLKIPEIFHLQLSNALCLCFKVFGQFVRLKSSVSEAKREI